MNVNELLDVHQMSEWLGYSVYTIRAKARQGEIPGHKPFGPLGGWRFDPAEVATKLGLNANTSVDSWAAPARQRRAS